MSLKQQHGRLKLASKALSEFLSDPRIIDGHGREVLTMAQKEIARAIRGIEERTTIARMIRPGVIRLGFVGKDICSLTFRPYGIGRTDLPGSGEWIVRYDSLPEGYVRKRFPGDDEEIYFLEQVAQDAKEWIDHINAVRDQKLFDGLLSSEGGA